jgi:DNA-binding transcriptional ArsR family regulator
MNVRRRNVRRPTGRLAADPVSGGVDIVGEIRETGWMLAAGVARNRLAGVLGAAFAGGLLSEATLSHRLSVLFAARLVDPCGLVGDLSLRTRRRRRWSSSYGWCVRSLAPGDHGRARD